MAEKVLGKILDGIAVLSGTGAVVAIGGMDRAGLNGRALQD